MTISPPAKVKLEDFRPLSSNIDTLYLSININWSDNRFFSLCEEGKKLAAGNNQDTPLSGLENFISPPPSFNIKAHGSDGYAWILYNHEYVLRIGNWLSSKQRPSIMVEIHSETLWHLGFITAVKTILDFINNLNGKIHSVKPSRVDLCLDLLVPDIFWNISFTDYLVTRASDMVPHYRHKKLTGVSIGKGNISARFYDKELEIRQKSKKYWMYIYWGFQTVPEGKKVIRVEFQLRREIVKELGINLIYELFYNLDNVWGYCTKEWLKFQDNPGKHHTQRKTLPWWKIVQNSFLGVRNPEPLVRCKAYNTDEKFIQSQLFGAFTSKAALNKKRKDDLGIIPTIDIDRIAYLTQKQPIEIIKKIEQKQAKYHRSMEKMRRVQTERVAKGHPSNLNRYLSDHEETY